MSPDSTATAPTGTWNSPTTLGPLTLKNRVVKSATFEGRCERNQVTDGLIEFHREYAAGGVAMTTLAFCAVTRNARGAPDELILAPESVEGLSRLADAVHAEGALVNAQIGHAGAVAAATGIRAKAPSKLPWPLAMRLQALTDSEIREIISDFAKGARILQQAGFDAVELHFGHGYLPSEFLSPKLNKRKDSWGGSLENRARFCREIARAVRERVGTSMAITAKLNMDDGVPGGLWLEESVEIGRMLAADGHLDALQLTCGSSLQNPMYLFRGDVPLHEMADTMPRIVRPAVRAMGGIFFKEYPFTEAYMLTMARQFLHALDIPLILLGGINRAETIDSAVAEGFAMVAIGRALLRDPALLLKFSAGEATEGLCVQCNKCMPTIYTGTRCVLR